MSVHYVITFFLYFIKEDLGNSAIQHINSTQFKKTESSTGDGSKRVLLQETEQFFLSLS